MSNKKPKITFPLGRAGLLALQLNSLRDECCYAAKTILQQEPLNEAELDEAARLDDAIAETQRILKTAVARIVHSRHKRRNKRK